MNTILKFGIATELKTTRKLQSSDNGLRKAGRRVSVFVCMFVSIMWLSTPHFFSFGFWVTLRLFHMSVFWSPLNQSGMEPSLSIQGIENSEALISTLQNVWWEVIQYQRTTIRTCFKHTNMHTDIKHNCTKKYNIVYVYHWICCDTLSKDSNLVCSYSKHLASINNRVFHQIIPPNDCFFVFRK